MPLAPWQRSQVQEPNIRVQWLFSILLLRFTIKGRISCLGTASEARGSVCLLEFSFFLESHRATVPLKSALGSPSIQTWHTLTSAKWPVDLNKLADFFMIVLIIITIIIIICLHSLWTQPGHGNVLECVWRTRLIYRAQGIRMGRIYFTVDSSQEFAMRVCHEWYVYCWWIKTLGKKIWKYIPLRWLVYNDLIVLNQWIIMCTNLVN